MKLWRVQLRRSLSCTTSQVTLQLIARFSTEKTLASTTAVGRIIAFKRSKQPLSSIQNLKPPLRFTVRLRKPTTHNLAADKGYDWMNLCEKLREEGVTLIKNRIFRPIDHVHNARVDGPRYCQRSMCETVFSSIKHTHGDAVRARTWYREFREIKSCVATHRSPIH